MFTNKMWTLLLALCLAFNIAVVVAEDLRGPPEPPWFQRISASFVGVNLQKCIKRSKAPANGTKCSRKAKTCYFGNQDCAGVGPHPLTKCVCSSQTWKCEAETCPSVITPDVSANGCTADGKADLSSNDPLCPSTGPLEGNQFGCVPALYGKTCMFGTEKWYAMIADLLCVDVGLVIFA